jgi:hypothetical protein
MLNSFFIFSKKNRWYRTPMRVDEKGVISGWATLFFRNKNEALLDLCLKIVFLSNSRM